MCVKARAFTVQDRLCLAWRCWPLVFLGWLFLSVYVTAQMKHNDKAMLSVWGNGVFGTLLLSFSVLQEDRKALCGSIGSLLFISLLTAGERNLTNFSMSSIGASLKTALHGINVPLTFFVALLFGVDQGRRGSPSSVFMVPILLVVASGGMLSAVCGPTGAGQVASSRTGIALQMGSSLCCALKYTCVKLLLGAGAPRRRTRPQSLNEVRLLSDVDGVPAVQDTATAPSKTQLAFVSQPITGLVALAVFLHTQSETQIVQTPSPQQAPLDISTCLFFGMAATCLFLFEMQLLELTSPTDVAVMSAAHNVIIFLYFVIFDGEIAGSAEVLGFTVSTMGAVGYALLKRAESQRDRRRVIQTFLTV